MFSAGSSGNWNVSFFSMALQSGLDLVGTEHAMHHLKVKNFILWSIHVDGSKVPFSSLFFSVLITTKVTSKFFTVSRNICTHHKIIILSIVRLLKN